GSYASNRDAHVAQSPGDEFWSDEFNYPGVGSDNNLVSDVSEFRGQLIVAGGFQESNGPGNGVALWDGNSWSTLGTGVNGGVAALMVYNDRLYVGGAFTQAGGSPASNVAVWDGTSWSALGSGVNGRVEALC